MVVVGDGASGVVLLLLRRGPLSYAASGSVGSPRPASDTDMELAQTTEEGGLTASGFVWGGVVIVDISPRVIGLPRRPEYVLTRISFRPVTRPTPSTRPW